MLESPSSLGMGYAIIEKDLWIIRKAIIYSDINVVFVVENLDRVRNIKASDVSRLTASIALCKFLGEKVSGLNLSTSNGLVSNC